MSLMLKQYRDVNLWVKDNVDKNERYVGEDLYLHGFPLKRKEFVPIGDYYRRFAMIDWNRAKENQNNHIFKDPPKKVHWLTIPMEEKKTMKQSELNQILREIIAEELAKETYLTHPDWDEEHGDGYSNEFQRAYAHSQATTPRTNDTKKAEALAKQGKYVVLVRYPVHCKATDAILGDAIQISKVLDNREEAEKLAHKENEEGMGDVSAWVVGPEDLNKPKETPSASPTSPDDDVPFQESKKMSRLEKLKARRDPEGIEEQSLGGKPQWTGNMKAALQELNSRMKKELDPNFETKLLDVQLEWGLDDYQTYLVGENSTYPTTPDLWKTLANGKFAKFVQMDEVNHTTTDQGKPTIAVGAPNSLARFIVEHPALIEQMRDWVKECSWGERFEDSDIDDMTPEQLIAGVQRHYEGGLKQFMIDAKPIMKTESKTFREIRNELDPDGKKHDLTLTCEKCGTTETCRCSQPKRKFKGICDKCSSQKEGYGYVHDKDMAKDPKHIKGERWRIKFQSEKDLKKHGNTEKSPIKESMDGNCQCGGQLKYTADIGAPGSGQSWECQKCKKGYVKMGNSFVDPTQVDPHEAPPWELDPSDVMETKITMKEFRSIVKELINEMWVGWEEVKTEGYPGDTWNPVQFTRSPQIVADLIFSLKDGTGITFMYDKEGRSNVWEAVEKVIEGDEYVYRMFGPGDPTRYPLETDEEVRDFAKGIVNNPHLIYYEYHKIHDYKRPRYEPDDDQAIGDYEKYDPDRPDWREMYEAKGMTPKEKLRNIIRESLKEVMSSRFEHDDSKEEAREVEIAKEIRNLADSIIIGDAQHDPYLKHKARIVKLCDELIKMHQHGQDVPIKGKFNPSVNESRK